MFRQQFSDLYAIDVETGGVLWRYRVGEAITSAPAVADALVAHWNEKETL